MTMMMRRIKLFVAQRRHAGQHLAFEKFQRRAAAGRSVRHFLVRTELLRRRGRVAAANNSRCTSSRRGNNGVGHRLGGLFVIGKFKYARRPVPNDRLGAGDDRRELLGRFRTRVETFATSGNAALPANRGEPITVIFVNNGIYGMTGGQMAPTTPLGKKSTTSPYGRSAFNEGYPLHVCELLNSLEAPVFIERVALGNNKQIMNAARDLRRAVENHVKGLGFSFVEVLSPCPTIWKMNPLEAQTFVREEMAATFGVANYRDHTKQALERPAAPPPPALEDLPRILGLSNGQPIDEFATPTRELDLRIKVAGFGGQGVLMLGEVLAEAGLESGYEVSWLPSYGPEMRSGTSNCHVRLSNHPIDSPERI